MENNKITFWDTLTDEVDNLYIAGKIKDIGLPNNSVQRAEILKRLSSTAEGQYHLEYDKMCDYSENFREAYPLDKVLYLVKETITNTQNYIIDINNSNLSDEDKALLFFVLPL